jgi:hypothetical protein
VVFSEGRGLRARVAGPYQRQGVAFSPDDDARGRMAYRGDARVKPRRSHAGVRSPPLRGGEPGGGGLAGEPGNNAKDDFLGEARSPRPGGRAVRKRGVGRDERGVIERPVA